MNDLESPDPASPEPDPPEPESSAAENPALLERRRLLGWGSFAAGTAVGAGGLWAAGFGQNPSKMTHEEREAAAGADNAVGLGTARSQSVYWSVETTDKHIALTFDDGPDPRYTPRILEILDAFDVPATFLMMGANVESHPDIAREVVAEGHEIGNHTHEHLDLAFQTVEETVRQVSLGHRRIADVTGVASPRWFRPPRGDLSGSALRCAAELDYDLLLWSLIGSHPSGVGSGNYLGYMLSGTTPGSIVTLHDGLGRGTFDPDAEFALELRARRDRELELLPDYLRGLIDDGFEFFTASQLVDRHPPGSATRDP